jgi:PAS domain-containing protein
MYWLILGVLCALFAVTALLLWQKWAAPWPQIEQLVSQIARGESPSTFLINGGADPHRIGLALETIFARQRDLERQIAGRESDTQTILGAMEDGVLVVDARSLITLMNPTFRRGCPSRNARSTDCGNIEDRRGDAKRVEHNRFANSWRATYRSQRRSN